ncbi:MAG: DUF2007 domain-containing protein [Candidatus Alcyoniella australis]|nr:DUF2007 domain-containing protein [Candidatus Alcyoniella australis]
MRYCPKCGAEYVDEALICNDCEVALVDTKPQPAADEHDELVDVYTPSNRIELELARAALEEQGIDCVVADHETLNALLSEGIATVNVRLQVPSAQLEQAQGIIKQIVEAGPVQDLGDDNGERDDDVPEIVRYCHHCAVDYRIDIERCQICGEKLHDHPPTDKELEGVVAWEPLSKIELDIVGPGLEQTGIAYSAVDLTPAGDYVGESVTAPQIQVRVPESDLPRARQIIAEAVTDAELPDDFDPGPPAE